MLPVKSNLLPTVSKFFEDDWNSLFDWSNRNYLKPTTSLPSVNIEQTSDSYIIQMAVPGLKKEDFSIELRNNDLIIKAESSHQSEDNDEKYFTRREFNFNSFQRVFHLNHKVVDHQKVDATYEDGILSVHIAKQEKAKEKPSRLIAVK